jgi:lactoylglutathione lyase
MTDSFYIHHVNVMVDDLDVADAFYGGVLGLERAPTPDLGFPAQFYRVGDRQEIHVNQMADIHPERSHLCLRVDDFNAVFARAVELGIIETETWGKVRRLPTGVMQAFVRDPSGNLIELSCEAEQAVDPAIFELDFVDSESRFFQASN